MWAIDRRIKVCGRETPPAANWHVEMQQFGIDPTAWFKTMMDNLTEKLAADGGGVQIAR